jgi:hypothetical protein
MSSEILKTLLQRKLRKGEQPSTPTLTIEYQIEKRMQQITCKARHRLTLPLDYFYVLQTFIDLVQQLMTNIYINATT